jgi:hypothetical protein
MLSKVPSLSYETRSLFGSPARTFIPNTTCDTDILFVYLTVNPLPLTTVMSSTFIPSLIALSLAYRLISPFYTSHKQLAWILTSVSSAVMTLTSIPFLWDYVASGGSVKSVPTLAPLAVAANRFFQAYLTASVPLSSLLIEIDLVICSDMVIGAMYYRDQIGLLTGWIHHIVYILIVEMALRRSWAHIFCLCCFMEVCSYSAHPSPSSVLPPPTYTHIAPNIYTRVHDP